MIENRIAAQADLRKKIHELFDSVHHRLDQRIDALIASGCGIVDDHEKRSMDSYLVPKAFISAFLKEESLNLRPLSHEGRELQSNYEKF